MDVHDEVCGMTIDTEEAAASLEFLGERYYFCSQRCRRLFEKHPDRFVPVPDGWERTEGSFGGGLAAPE